MGQRSHDWKRARRLYERDQKSFAQIAEILGCDPHTVSDHCKREGWLSPQRVLAESAGDRVQRMIAGFIEQQGEAIRENLTRKHALNLRILALAERHIERLEQDRLFEMETGRRDKDGDPITVTEDPVKSLRTLSQVAAEVEAMDRSIASLKAGEWRDGEKPPAQPEPELPEPTAQLPALSKKLRESVPPEELMN